MMMKPPSSSIHDLCAWNENDWPPGPRLKASLRQSMAFTASSQLFFPRVNVNFPFTYFAGFAAHVSGSFVNELVGGDVAVDEPVACAFPSLGATGLDCFFRFSQSNIIRS